MLRTLVAGALLLLVTPQARAEVYPYETGVAQGSDNNHLDVSAAACSPSEGCFDRMGNRCDANPGKTCDLARVPLGRCSEGTSACVWPQGAGSCVVNPNIPCISDAQCPSSTCDLSLNEPSCACDANAPADSANGTYTICGNNPLSLCSDGDPYAQFNGLADAACTDRGALGASMRSNCGDAAGGERSPRFETENPSSVYTPQRDPGGGVSISNTRPVVRTRDTQAMELTEPGSFGIRRLWMRGESRWEDMGYTDSTQTGSFSRSELTYSCDPPAGHQIERVIDGFCAVGGAFCTSNSQCPGNDCNHGHFCHETATDSVGFVFLTQHDASAIAGAGLTGKCPPDCYLDYDFDSYEQEALETVAALDSNAGRQIALDHLGGRKYHGRSALLVPIATAHVWTPFQDMRCYVGGDPFRANPNDGKVGRCSGSPTPCATNADCGGAQSCRFCGGTHSSDPEYGALATTISPIDAARALPPGYNAFGYPELHLMEPGGNPARRRLGGITGVASNQRIVSFRLHTTGVAAALFKDHTCTPLGPDSCELGQVSGGPPGITTAQQRQIANVGIGVGGTFFYGVPFASGGVCCFTGADISWRPEHPTTPLSGLTRIADFGAGEDGIPGCFGDNSPGSSGANACNDVLGDPNTPGNTGSDDVVILYPNPNLAGNGGVFDPNAPPAIPATSTGFVHIPPSLPVLADPRFGSKNLPTLSFRSATPLRDLEADTVDSLTKTARTFCPIVGEGPRCSAPPDGDADGDGIPGSRDNCPFVANPAQEDRGRVGSAGVGVPDGIGDACQCGDITADGAVNGQDGIFITRHGLGYVDPVFVNGGNCDVTGNGLCNGQDGIFVTRAGLDLLDPPQLAPRSQRCHNADPNAPQCPNCAPCPSGTCS